MDNYLDKTVGVEQNVARLYSREVNTIAHSTIFRENHDFHLQVAMNAVAGMYILDDLKQLSD